MPSMIHILFALDLDSKIYRYIYKTCALLTNISGPHIIRDIAYIAGVKAFVCTWYSGVFISMAAAACCQLGSSLAGCYWNWRNALIKPQRLRPRRRSPSHCAMHRHDARKPLLDLASTRIQSQVVTYNDRQSISRQPSVGASSRRILASCTGSS